MAVEKLPGVAGAEVSLEDGMVRVELEPDNALTLGELRNAIRERGFSPREAEVRAAGRVELITGEPYLRFPAQPRPYRLVASDVALERLRAREGDAVVIVGSVPQSEEGEDPTTIHVSLVEDPGTRRASGGRREVTRASGSVVPPRLLGTVGPAVYVAST